jgi:hypothetical protein
MPAALGSVTRIGPPSPAPNLHRAGPKHPKRNHWVRSVDAVMPESTRIGFVSSADPASWVRLARPSPGRSPGRNWLRLVTGDGHPDNWLRLVSLPDATSRLRPASPATGGLGSFGAIAPLLLGSGVSKGMTIRPGAVGIIGGDWLRLVTGRSGAWLRSAHRDSGRPGLGFDRRARPTAPRRPPSRPSPRRPAKKSHRDHRADGILRSANPSRGIGGDPIRPDSRRRAGSSFPRRQVRG